MVSAKEKNRRQIKPNEIRKPGSPGQQHNCFSRVGSPSYGFLPVVDSGSKKKKWGERACIRGTGRSSLTTTLKDSNARTIERETFDAFFLFLFFLSTCRSIKARDVIFGSSPLAKLGACDV